MNPWPILALVAAGCTVPPSAPMPGPSLRLCLATGFPDAAVELVLEAWPDTVLTCERPDAVAFWTPDEYPLGVWTSRGQIRVSVRAAGFSPNAVGIVLAHEVGHAYGLGHADPPCWCDLMCPIFDANADACIVREIRGR